MMLVNYTMFCKANSDKTFKCTDMQTFSKLIYKFQIFYFFCPFSRNVVLLSCASCWVNPVYIPGPLPNPLSSPNAKFGELC